MKSSASHPHPSLTAVGGVFPALGAKKVSPRKDVQGRKRATAGRKLIPLLETEILRIETTDPAGVAPATAARIIPLMAASMPGTTVLVMEGSKPGAARLKIRPISPPAPVVSVPEPIGLTEQIRAGLLMSSDGARTNLRV